MKKENSNKRNIDKNDLAARNSKNPIRRARRSIWYALRLMLVATLILLACYCVFVEGMYLSNIYIIVTEAMPLRANVILTEGAIADMERYFTEDFLNSDPMLYEGTYSDYTVNSYDYRYDVESISVMPWSKSAKVTYVERIPRINAEADAEAEDSEFPEWVAARYSIALEKIEGRWFISEIEVLEVNPEEETKPTPDYSQLEGSAEPSEEA